MATASVTADSIAGSTFCVCEVMRVILRLNTDPYPRSLVATSTPPTNDDAAETPVAGKGRPTPSRAEQEAAAKKSQQEKRKTSDMDDYLDIPAFLRRQAD